MLAFQYLVTHLNDQCVRLVAEPLAGMVRVSGRFLQDGIRGYHLPRDQILADAKVLKRALGLGSPQFVGGNLDLAEAVTFGSIFRHNNRREFNLRGGRTPLFSHWLS